MSTIVTSDLPGMRHAAPTDDEARLTRGTLAVLEDFGLRLGDDRHRLSLIGGLVPVLRLDDATCPYVGSADIDVAFAPAEWRPGEFSAMIERLAAAGYEPTSKQGRFQLVRMLPDSDRSVDIDFLVDREPEKTNDGVPTVVDGFPLHSSRGLDAVLAERDDEATSAGAWPRPASVAAYMGIKAQLWSDRYKPKDAYDIHFCVRYYPGGHHALARDVARLFDRPSGTAAWKALVTQFESHDAFGPVCVRRYMEDRGMSEDDAEQWQDDAFRQVQALLRAIAELTGNAP